MKILFNQKNALRITALFAIIVASPIKAFAWDPLSGLVPECNTLISQTTGMFTNPCNWAYLLMLANNLMEFMLYIAVPIAAICFMYAGWLYLSARGNPGQITKAHDIFLSVFIGLVIVLVAWLVVDEIFKMLVDKDAYIPVLIGEE